MKKTQLTLITTLILMITGCVLYPDLPPKDRVDAWAVAQVDSSGIADGSGRAAGPGKFPVCQKCATILSDGWIVLEMYGNGVQDHEGPDFVVYEVDNSYTVGGAQGNSIKDRYRVSVSSVKEYSTNSKEMNWIEMGIGVGVNRFDLGEVGLLSAKWIRIEGVAVNKTHSFPGPDIDAVMNLHWEK